MTLYIFAPHGATAYAQHDSGWGTPGVWSTYDGRPALGFAVPHDTPNGHGLQIQVFDAGILKADFRAKLWLRTDDMEDDYPWHPGQEAALELDDFRFPPFPDCVEPTPEPPSPPTPDPTDPVSIIRASLAKFPAPSQRVDFLKDAARSLNRAGISSGTVNGMPRGPFGILRKTSGHHCGGYSCDIIAAGNGSVLQGQWDVLINDTDPAFNGPLTAADGARIDICEPQLP